MNVKKKNKGRKIIASVLAASMVMTSVPAWAVAATDFPDMPQNWSTAALNRAVEDGLLAGIDGKICADDYLTRAQMAAIMVRAFGTETKSDLSGYTDVESTDWYYQALSSAVSMGVLSGYDNKLNPNSNITRQEVCSVLARAFMLSGGSTSNLNQFADANKVGSWAQGSMAAMVNAGYLHGDNGNLRPTAYITRAEFAAIMSNLASSYIKSAGIVTSVNKGNVVIGTAGVTLSGVTVEGDLILADGIGLGDVTLDNVKVTGRIVVRGGGDVSLTGNSSANTVAVANRNGKTALSVEKGTSVNSITSSTALNVTGSGKVGTVTVTAGTSSVATPNTTVKNNGGTVTAAGKAVPNGATAVINSNATSATVTGSTAASGGSSGSSSSSSSSGGSSGGSSSTQEKSVYALMNIPYDEFYAAEVNDDMTVDAVSSATKNKTRAGNLAGGSYHVNPDGTDISGVTYPVKMSKSVYQTIQNKYKQIQNSDSIDITVSLRGKEQTTTYQGADSLFENENYAYYLLNDTPDDYKELTIGNDGTMSFGKAQGAVTTVQNANVEVATNPRHTDYQLNVEGLDLDASSDKVYGVVLTTADGKNYGLRHVVNIWRITELGWNADETGYEDLGSKDISKITYYTSKGIYEVNTDINLSQDAVYVLMNIPYDEFYTAAGIRNNNFDYDAISSATNKVGNYGKAGGAYHEAATAELAADGTVTAVGGANGAKLKGVIWPVKVSSVSTLENLGGTKITDETKKTVATVGRGQTSSTDLVSYETLMEAPTYSYYMLSGAPASYLELTVNGTTAMFKAGEEAAEEKTEIETTTAYGTNWGDVQLGLAAADEASDKIINAVVVTAKDENGEETKVGMVHLYNIWSASDIAWRAAQTPGLDGKTITNIRYYCSVKDTDNSDNVAPAYVNYVYDYPTNLDISAIYTGTMTATFKDSNTITIAGLPTDAENVKAKVYHTTGGRNPVYTYLTPLQVDPSDDDIDPITVDVVDGEITITLGSVTNEAGTTVEYGQPVHGTEYTIELSSDNWIINKITAVYEDDSVGGIKKTGEATVESFDYTAKVKVTIDEDGKIVTVMDNGTEPGNNSSFWTSAKGIFEKLVGKTASEVDAVDAVSGATVSSNAIKEAVKNALN